MLAELLAISKIKVGASPEFPVLAVREQVDVTGPEDQTLAAMKTVVWTLRCLGDATEETSIRSFNNTIQTQLCRIGDQVTLTERGEATVLPAAGASGCMPGYPIVKLSAIPDESYGQWQTFELTVEARIPQPDQLGLVYHSQEKTTTTDTDGNVSVDVTGEVRVAPGSNAATWAQENVLAAAAAIAAVQGNSFSKKTVTNSDTAFVRYSYTTAPVTAGTNSGLTEASVDDRSTTDTTGRVTRVISGYAGGVNASTFAASQDVGEGTNRVLVRQEGPTPPSTPSGRVTFRYEYVSGSVDARFPGIYIVSLEEDVDPVSGGKPIQVAEFLGAAPTLRLGREGAYVYRQTSRMQFIGGTWAAGVAGLLSGFSADNLNGPPRIRKSVRGKIREVTVSYEIITATPVDPVPDPREVEAL